MTSTNSYDFSITRDNIIDMAYQYIGVIEDGDTSSTNQYTEAARLLNMIVKNRAAMGMPTWALKRGYILPFSGASSIATDSHVVTAYDTTTLSADSAASDTTLTVTSITGFSNGDQLGIELNDGSIDWTTINGAPSGTTITATTGVTSAASSGNRIYGYTASSERVQKPLRIIDANRLVVSDDLSVPIKLYSQPDYFALTNRTNEGQPLGIYYNWASTSMTNLDNGSIFIYPRMENGDTIIEFTYHRQFQDFDATGDNPDFPQAFYLPLMVELAAFLGPKNGVSLEERKAIFIEAEIVFNRALDTITPEESIFIVPSHV